MEFLVIQSGKISREWDHLEISHQNCMDLEVAKLSSGLKSDGICSDNYLKDLHLVARLQELLSEQELR